ncbi:MAG TPA: TonB-dependent receptor [Gemmatimonadales bacterium]|nr:TonB-dependent receptor [Gemmatimonadales bacterium]
MIRAGLLALALAAVGAGALSAQRPAAAQADTTRKDTTAVRDTTQRDTLPALLPIFASAIAPGPLPRGMRYTFTVDSLLLTSAHTLSDVLSHIPGVYVVRGGWYGQPEIVLYAGRGPASLEVYWDGVRYMPLGRDSLYLDPARIPLAPLERIDVMLLPAALQIYLVTARQRSTATSTHVGIMTGNFDIAEYRAGYSTRTRSGFGASLVADWNSIGVGPVNATTTPFGASDIFLKFDYVPPDGRVGASFQVLSSSWHRTGSTNGLVPGWRQDRYDRQLRFFVAQRNDGLGYRVTTSLATSRISHDTAVANRMVSGAVIEASNTWSHANIVATARFGAAHLPQQFEARAGMNLLSRFTVAGGIRQSFYEGQRAGLRGFAAAGLILPLGFSARAEGAWQHDVQAPFIAADSVQEATDVAAWIRFDSRRLTLEVGRGRRDPFAPLGFAAGILPIDSLGPTAATNFLAAHGSFELLPGLRFAGWYYDPLTGGADFEPPHHSRLSVSFYSKFWRVFKSGIFALRAEGAIESWSRSRLGGIFVDSTRTVSRAINGASFVDTNLEMQLAGVTLFWTVQNINLMRSSYLAGLGFPRSAQRWGARWFFTN